VKKLISIGVALALLTMAVVPGAVAAYTPPATYSKVPFAIIQSGFELLDQILPDVLHEFAPDIEWVADLMAPIGEWAGGPLSWTVDMLAWGLDFMATLWATADLAFDIGFPEIGDLLHDAGCGLLTCWSDTNCTGNFTCP
jgi:hypothetical protein